MTGLRGLVLAGLMSSYLVPALGADGSWAHLPMALLPTNAPQTEAEKERGKEQGRALPTPEPLQPTLDVALPHYLPRGDLHLTGKFTAAASDVLPGLVRRWIEQFRQYYPGVDIELAPPYAGSVGAKELIKQNLDFVFVSRELKPDDIGEFQARFGYPPLSVPISGGSYRHYGFLDAIGFFVHPENPLAQLSFEQLDAIFSSTRHHGGKALQRWGELGLKGAWADKPIHAFGVKPWNGFEEFVRQRVLSVGAQRGEWSPAVKFDPVVFPIAARVGADRYGIGYAGLAYVDAPVRLLALAPTADGPFVTPSYDNVALARYPLSRLIFFNVNKKPGEPLPAAVEEFLRFVLSQAGQQTVLDQAIFLPLRARQANASRALLNLR